MQTWPKLAFIGAVVVTLAACAPSPAEYAAQRSVIQEQLPPGCKFKWLGNYGSMQVAAVICADGVTTTNYRYGCGKNCTRNVATVSMREER